MPNPDEGFFHIPGEKSPAVRVGEEVEFRLGPSSEMHLRLAEVEKRLGIAPDPIRYPRTTLVNPGTTSALPKGKSSAPTPTALPNPLQAITNFLNSLPPLPPLPFTASASASKPLIRERVASPPEVTEEAAVVSRKLNPQTEIIPLVLE